MIKINGDTDNDARMISICTNEGVEHMQIDYRRQCQGLQTGLLGQVLS